jgi:hypothetical protein
MNILQKAIQLLEKYAPEELYAYHQNQEKHGFEFWLSSASPLYGIPGAVHESIHQINAKLSDFNRRSFSITKDKTLRIPRLKTFARSEISQYLPSGQQDDYYKEYLCGQSGKQGYDSLLEELNAYIHGCRTAVRMQHLYGDHTQTSERDGLAAMMYFTQLYLRHAQQQRKDTWEALRREKSIIEVTGILWSLAAGVINDAIAFPHLGIKDEPKRRLASKETSVQTFLKKGSANHAQSNNQNTRAEEQNTRPHESESGSSDSSDADDNSLENQLENLLDSLNKTKPPSDRSGNPLNLNMVNGRIVVNGKEYRGNNIQIVNGKVVVDGVEQDEIHDHKITVTVHGDVKQLQTSSGNVTAENVGTIQTNSGDVNCGDVSGSVKTMSGDVRCGTVKGNVKTMSGDIL